MFFIETEHEAAFAFSRPLEKALRLGDDRVPAHTLPLHRICPAPIRNEEISDFNSDLPSAFDDHVRPVAKAHRSGGKTVDFLEVIEVVALDALLLKKIQGLRDEVRFCHQGSFWLTPVVLSLGAIPLSFHDISNRMAG